MVFRVFPFPKRPLYSQSNQNKQSDYPVPARGILQFTAGVSRKSPRVPCCGLGLRDENELAEGHGGDPKVDSRDPSADGRPSRSNTGHL